MDFYLTDTANHIIESLHQAVKEDAKKKQRLFHNIKVPVLFIKSKKDRVIPQRDLERAYMMMHGAEMVEVEKAHHDLFPQMPKKVGNHILNFLKKNHLVDKLNFSKIVSLLLPALGIGLLSSPEFLTQFLQGGITGASVVGGTTLATKVGGLVLFKTIIAAALLWAFHRSNKH